MQLPGGHETYLQRFFRACAENPSRPAIVEPHRTVSYAEFESLARRIGTALVERAALPRVLIHLPQCAEAYAAMFAAAIAGGFYTTTNVSTPPERRRMIFEEFGPNAVLTNAELSAEAQALAPSAQIIDVERVASAELNAFASAHRLAYVMFTSGSTGRPKGVMVPKQALSHYVDWCIDAMAVTPADRWSQHPNIAFDLSVLDIYGALCAGAALVPIVDARDTLMPAKAISRHELTIWDSVPSVVTSMIKLGQATARNFAPLRMLTFCGEPLHEMHLDAIFRARPDVIVHNTYGPTEATVSCTLLRLTADNYKDACRSSVAIGDAIPGMELHLVDGPGENEGEIAITGPQLADGYWNSPDLTARQFRSLTTAHGTQRAYYTGDWASRIKQHMFFTERIDTQVKIRGERVELGDIGAALMKTGLGFACVLLIGETLHGVFEHEGPLPPDDQLREAIGQHLPLHLVPRHFHALSELPRNANGKVDLKALAKMLSEQPSQRAGP